MINEDKLKEKIEQEYRFYLDNLEYQDRKIFIYMKQLMLSWVDECTFMPTGRMPHIPDYTAGHKYRKDVFSPTAMYEAAYLETKPEPPKSQVIREAHFNIPKKFKTFWGKVVTFRNSSRIINKNKF
jgi:hypothetical protein